MTRTSHHFACRSCGAESPRWVGRCPRCGEWDAMVELPSIGGPGAGLRDGAADSPPPVPLDEVPFGAAVVWPTGVGELDHVLGGGLVPGSVSLLGGEPGVGKSTLVLQALDGLARRGARCLLVTGEESLSQVRLRGDRLGIDCANLLVLAEPSLEHIEEGIDTAAPDVLAVDSIQTLSHPGTPGPPGSLSQVRDSAQALVRLAKAREMSVVLIGHVTKDGDLAGPRSLEHLVDTVLSVEGDRDHALRLLRSPKHRFGSTRELGVMEMGPAGLRTVVEPSRLFLADRLPGTPGSVVAPVLEGARPLLVEVQALVTTSSTAQPRRSAQGVDGGRLAMLAAVLASRVGIPLGRDDVYVSVAGGLRVGEPGADLAVALAIAGARMEVALEPATVALGEIGLGGEIRQVSQPSQRLAEAARMGFRRALVAPSTPRQRGVELVPVRTVAEAVAVATAGAVAAGVG